MGWISACFIAVIVFADFSSTLPIPETSTSKPAKTRSILKRIRSTVDRSSNADSEITTTTPDPDDIELSLSNLFDIAPTVFEYRYAVIIDAGSSHTDLVIYKWSTDKINGTGIVTQENHVVCKGKNLCSVQPPHGGYSGRTVIGWVGKKPEVLPTGLRYLRQSYVLLSVN